MINSAYLRSDRTAKGDESCTPFYAVEPLLEFIPKDKIIWLPFDEEWSAYYQLLTENGYNVIRSHISDGKDFFEYEPENYDIIISNPPYSIKDAVLDRLYDLDKPFAMLLPVQAIQSKHRFKHFYEDGVELLCFNARVDYHKWGDFEHYATGTPFGSIYVCRNFLPEKLMFRKLNKYERKLKDNEE